MQFSKVEELEAAHREMDSSISVFDTMQCILLMLDKNGRISYFNKYMQQISGYRLEEVKGRDWFDTFIPERDRGRTKELFKKAINDIQTEGNINPIVTKDGQEREIEWYDKTLKDAKGSITGLIAIGHDITERRKVENQIRQRKEDLELVNRLNDVINQGGSLTEALETLDSETKKMYSGYGVTVYLLSDDGQYLLGQNLSLPPKIIKIIEKTIGIKIPEMKIKLDEKSLYADIIRTGKPRIINEPELIEQSMAEFTDKEFIKKLVPKINKILGMRSLMSVPLISKGQAIGHIDISGGETFDKGDLQRFTTIAGQITSIIKRKKDEENLKLALTELSQIFETAADGMCLIGKDFNILKANKAYLALAGFSNYDEVRGKKCYEIFRDSRCNTDKCSLKRILRGEDYVECDVEKELSGGAKISCIVSATPHLKPDGELLGIVENYKDITERKQAQKALYESEEKYRGLVGNVRLGIFRSTPGPCGRFLEVNPAMQEITGYSREELLSMDVCSLFLNPKQRETVLDKMSQATGTITKELKFKKKDGSRIVVSDTKAPIKDSDGKVLYFDGIMEDITERKQAEEELKESEERYRALFESTFDIVQSVAPNGSFIFVNSAWFKTLGYTRDELPGKKIFDIIHPKSLKHCRGIFNRVMSGEAVHNTQAIFVAKDGREIQVEGNAIPRIIDGKVIASQGFYRDITERKMMEEQLIVTDRLASIGELASGIAHELNNPLTGVIGFSELLLEKDVPNEIREDIAIIHHEAVRASEVVKNLLTFARKHTPSKQSVNINSIIASVLGLHAYEQKVSNIDVITRFAPDLPDVIADGFQLQQVFLNIIVNAGYAMEEAHNRGVITIKTERTNNTVRIIFIDDGPGISKENLSHIFDPFFTTKEVGKGTGLGLSICYGIITEHKGKISVLSEQGKGATFIVELPISKPDKEGGGE